MIDESKIGWFEKSFGPEMNGMALEYRRNGETFRQAVRFAPGDEERARELLLRELQEWYENDGAGET